MMNRRVTVQLVAAIVVLVFTLGIWLEGGEVEGGWLRFYSAAVFMGTIALTAWEHLLWHAKIAQKWRLAPRDLRGTWKGLMESSWIDPTTAGRSDPQLAFLVIRQTASACSITLLTDKSKSKSTLGRVQDDGALATLDYMYLNKPHSRYEERSRIHHGSTSLDISGRPATRLRGRYWTDRDTRGELDMTQRDNTLADDYEQACGLFEE